jgi:hypothetical protein
MQNNRWCILFAIVVFGILAAGCVSETASSDVVVSSPTIDIHKRPISPVVEKLTFKELSQRNPEDVADYLNKNFQYNDSFYWPPEQDKLTPKQLLDEGKGNSADVAFIFGLLLLEKGWDVRGISFDVVKNGKIVYAPGVVVYKDPRDQKNYYLVAEPPFTIYPMGQADDPLPLEEVRLGGKIASDSLYTYKFSKWWA